MDNTTTNVQGEQWEGTAKPFNFNQLMSEGPVLPIVQDSAPIPKKRISYKSELEKMRISKSRWKSGCISAIGLIIGLLFKILTS